MTALRHPCHAGDRESAVMHDGRPLHGIEAECEEEIVFEHGQTVSPFPADGRRGWRPAGTRPDDSLVSACCFYQGLVDGAQLNTSEGGSHYEGLLRQNSERCSVGLVHEPTDSRRRIGFRVEQDNRVTFDVSALRSLNQVVLFTASL